MASVQASQCQLRTELYGAHAARSGNCSKAHRSCGIQVLKAAFKVRKRTAGPGERLPRSCAHPSAPWGAQDAGGSPLWNLRDFAAGYENDSRSSRRPRSSLETDIAQVIKTTDNTQLTTVRTARCAAGHYSHHLNGRLSYTYPAHNEIAASRGSGGAAGPRRTLADRCDAAIQASRPAPSTRPRRNYGRPACHTLV